MSGGGCTAILWPRRDDNSVQFWEEPIVIANSRSKKRAKTEPSLGEGNSSANDKAEIARLKKELAEAKSQNERWKTVNNQLVVKLKGST